MPKRKQQSEVDVSKGLFMDLAFLLIAALVLMVNEPAQEEVRLEKSKAEAEEAEIQKKLDKLELRPSAVKTIVNSKLGGESIWVRQKKGGTIFEILPGKGGDKELDSVPSDPELKKLEQRIKDMTQPRWLQWHVDPDVPYKEFFRFHEFLQRLRKEGILDRCLEILRPKDEW